MWLTRHDRFLWPTYTEDASNYHVLLIALIVSAKQREHLSIWGRLVKYMHQLQWWADWIQESFPTGQMIFRVYSTGSFR